MNAVRGEVLEPFRSLLILGCCFVRLFLVSNLWLFKQTDKVGVISDLWWDCL